MGVGETTEGEKEGGEAIEKKLHGEGHRTPFCPDALGLVKAALENKSPFSVLQGAKKNRGVATLRRSLIGSWENTVRFRCVGKRLMLMDGAVSLRMTRY